MAGPRWRSVCVFCASSESIDPRYGELAAAVGTAIGDRGMSLVTGGGRVSMMGQVTGACRARGGHTVGVIPRALTGWEVVDDASDELLVTETMHERKMLMDDRSDAFLALPGGIGTLEELLEVWTARSLGMHRKPVVVLDPWGDFAGLHAVMDHLVESGFVRHSVAAELVWADEVDAALDAIERAWGVGEGAGVELPDFPSGRPDVLDELEAEL